MSQDAGQSVCLVRIQDKSEFRVRTKAQSIGKNEQLSSSESSVTFGPPIRYKE
jgi:hypothetical protein